MRLYARPCRTKPMQTVSPCESYGLSQSLCTPSQTPRHPSLPLLHTLTDPRTFFPPTVAHPHRPPDSLPSHCCTPSQTPRQPPLPLLHTIAKPLHSLLCHPGGETVEAVSTAASKAAEEAATGSWLKQLESGTLPRITAPGLSQGWFGPWETEEEALDHDDAAGRCPSVFQPSLQFQAGFNLVQCCFSF